jgi:predicted GNAT family acetyltransferase
MHGDSRSFSFGTYFLGIEDHSAFWSHLLTNQNLTDSHIQEVINYSETENIKPAVYFENRNDLVSLKTTLGRNGFNKIAEDSWMFCSKPISYQSNFNMVKKINTPDDLKIYIDTFNRCYQKNDPQNVYGELGDYLKSTARAWLARHTSDYIQYFLVFDNQEPVAVSALTNCCGIGYISNVGSLPSVRGKGFGKTATLFAIYQSQKNGNEIHCLATEEGTYPNEFYKRLGFKTKFTALLYEKK